MDWLKARLSERTTYVGIVTFLVGIAVQFFPSLKDTLTPDIVNAITLVLSTVGTLLFGATTKPATTGP